MISRIATLDVLWARFWRAGQSGVRDVRIDLFWLLGLGLVLIGIGIGLRDPWPADEPRFALIAHDMVRLGHWLYPQVGGDLYGDKPPLFFWMIAGVYWLTGSLRFAFLLPSLVAALTALLLVYDIARRLWNREVGFAAGWLLLVTLQFVWQGRQAQIDATLCCWTTLSLYGLLRHLLAGPAWRWYFIAWAAAGFGVITKAVGFLPLFVLACFFVLRRMGWQRDAAPMTKTYWSAGPLFFIAAVSTWLAPMLLFADTPELIGYRNEILFSQTVERYTHAWHHRQPFWYFVVEVIPPLWLPLSALLPWLWPRWRAAFRERDLRVVLPLLLTIFVVLFFSISTGKRGVYVLPAVPALVIAVAPFLPELFARRGVQRVFLSLAYLLSAVGLLGAIYMLAVPKIRTEVLAEYGIDGVAPLATMGLLALAACVLFRLRYAQWAYGASLAVVLVIVGVWVSPAINGERSGKDFVARVEQAAADAVELGLVGYREQHLLYFSKPTVNFGHARWREWEAEVADAAAWSMAQEGRALLMPDDARQRCFANASATPLGHANSKDWYLVQGPAEPTCVAEGDLSMARVYRPR